MSEYDEIINLPHFEPQRHRRMSKYMRAAQFSSFAALTGYGDDVAEKGRLTENSRELEEYELSILNERINEVIREQKNHPEIFVTFFVKDEKKQGGAYETKKIKVRLVDEANRLIIAQGGEKIPIDSVADISFKEE